VKRLPSRMVQRDSVWNKYSCDISSCVGVSEKLLWLRQGDSLGTLVKGNNCHWKPLPDNW
jgi:hypothetical protein